MGTAPRMMEKKVNALSLLSLIELSTRGILSQAAMFVYTPPANARMIPIASSEGLAARMVMPPRQTESPDAKFREHA